MGTALAASKATVIANVALMICHCSENQNFFGGTHIKHIWDIENTARRIAWSRTASVIIWTNACSIYSNLAFKQ